jgi:dolichol kinase
MQGSEGRIRFLFIHRHEMPEFPSTSSAPSHDEALPFAAELKRKALHLLALVVPFGMHVLGMPWAFYALLPLALLALTGDVARAYSERVNQFIRRIFGVMMRRRELPAAGDGVVINGATWVLVAATLLSVVFPLRIAVPIFTMFMVSDAVAALVGQHWGRHHWGSTARTIEGSIAFLFTGLGVMACFSGLPFLVSGAATLTACLAEALPGPTNDNLRVPITAATVFVLLEWWWLSHPVTLFPLLGGG